MANRADAFVERIRNAPVISGVCAAASPLALLATRILPEAIFVAGAVSPVANIGLGAIAAFNLLRERSRLSKIFSAAALGTAVLGLGAFVSQMNTPEFGPLVGYMATMASTTVAGIFNIAAHYTRNTHVHLSASVEHKEPKPPVAPPSHTQP